MKFAVRMSDGHGGDYRSALKADIAVAEMPQGLKILGQMAFDTSQAILKSGTGAWALDEVRVLFQFRVFSEDIFYDDLAEVPHLPQEAIDALDDDGVTLLPDSWEPPEQPEGDESRTEGRVECCSIAFCRNGYIQLHCLPKYGEGWLRSYDFWASRLEQAEGVRS